MLWYIIDGWNLIHKISQIKNQPYPREALISFIKKHRLTGSINNKVTIVFDGRVNLTDIQREKEFQIIFSQDRTADEVIGLKVKSHENKKQIIVVSDDREVISHVKNQGASSLRVKDFLVRVKNKRVDFNDSKIISYSLQREITEDLRKKWLKDQD